MPPCPTARVCANTGSDPYLGSSHARGRHDPQRRAPRRRRAGGQADRDDRDAAAPSRHGPLARAPARSRGPLGGRPRQASVPALRGRPHPPLPPPHGRRLVGLPPRTALAAQPAPCLARDPHAGARGGAVRRPGAGADDRLAHALRPAAREPRPGPAGGGLRRAGLPAAAPRGRSDPRDRRRPARPAHRRRHRQPLEGRGLLPRGGEPVAAPERGAGRAGPRDRRRHPPAMQASAEGGFQQRDPWVFERHGRPCRRCGTIIKARGQGDDNRTTYWCPACQA